MAFRSVAFGTYEEVQKPRRLLISCGHPLLCRSLLMSHFKFNQNPRRPTAMTNRLYESVFPTTKEHQFEPPLLLDLFLSTPSTNSKEAECHSQGSDSSIRRGHLATMRAWCRQRITNTYIHTYIHIYRCVYVCMYMYLHVYIYPRAIRR